MPNTNAAERHPSFVEIAGNPNLPNVLLIGDSISMGYTVPTRERLEGRANVYRPADNCGPTRHGLAQLDAWLGRRAWDVIHFNWGLHDLKHVDAQGRLADPSGSGPLASIDQYRENLGTLVERLKATGAKLVWATTTPVPAGANGRKQGDAAVYNAAATEVVNQPGITVNDLHAFALPRLQEIQLQQNVHFTERGSERLADQVVSAILERLGE